MRSRNHLDCRSAQAYKLPEKTLTLRISQVITTGVRENCCSATIADPLHCIGKGCPLVRHITRFARGQKAPENCIGIARMTGFNQESCKMRAADQFRILGITPCAREHVGDAKRSETIGHPLGADFTPRPYLRKTIDQGAVPCVNIQADDMQSHLFPQYRNLDAVYESQPPLLCRFACSRKPLDFIVVGQSEYINATLHGTFHQFSRAQQPIGAG